MAASFTILGSGSSGGVPRPALGWGACDPNNPRNRRRRTSLLVERRNGAGVTRVLVDTSPDLREQLLDADVNWLDAVLFTHEHADHTHGIDDLRGLFIHRRRRVDVYLDEPTSKAVRARFGYCFEAPAGSEYPPIVTEHRLQAGLCVTVDGEGGPITALPVLQEHGDICSLGFRFGRLAYSCDLSGLPEASVGALAGIEVWIVDALRYRPHPSHFSVEDALAWIARIKPGHAILTNLHADLDYAELRTKLPPHVEPAKQRLRRTAARKLADQLSPNLGDAQQKLAIVADIAVVANSLLEGLDEGPLAQRAPLQPEQFHDAERNLTNLARSARKLQSLLGPESASGRDVEAHASEMEDALGKVGAKVDELSERVGQARERTAGLRRELLHWTPFAQVAATVLFSWIGVGQLSLLVYGWSLYRKHVLSVACIH